MLTVWIGIILWNCFVAYKLGTHEGRLKHIENELFPANSIYKRLKP